MAADFATKRKEHLTRHTRTRHATPNMTDAMEPTPNGSVVAPSFEMEPTAYAVNVKMEPRGEGGGL